jgi:Domain of unknown function (DUF4114)
VLTFNTTFDDPAGTYARFYASIQSHVAAAGAIWSKYIAGSGSLEVIIRFSAGTDSIVSARSLQLVDLRTNGGLRVQEQGAAAEIRTGIDQNGTTPDIEFNFNPDNLINELWFDPDPIARTASVPSNKTDAVSAILHEFGHAIGFNGWKDDFTGALPADYQSTFDEKTSFDGTNFFFNGAKATALYGSAVPLTFGNITHLGNSAPRPGSTLNLDLMNSTISQGIRTDISALDLAILADLGVSIINAPAVAAPAVTSPPVTSPAVAAPAVTSPAVTSPAVTSPAVTTSSNNLLNVAKLQGQPEGELLDFRNFAGQAVKVDTVTTSDAAYNNYIGFYAVEDAQGTLANGLKVGDVGYAQAAIRSAVLRSFKTETQLDRSVTGGKILAPVVIANGTVEDFLSRNPLNQADSNIHAYFNYLGANPDKFDHFKLLGTNKFGVEDIYGGGDRDYNDIIFQANIKA